MEAHGTKLMPVALGVLFGALILVLMLMAAVPPVSRDALTHHLAVPKLYLGQGRMLELPDIIPSYFPMNLELLYLIPLSWGNDILPKYIHLAFGLFTALLLYRYLGNRLNKTCGLLGALFFLSLPVIVQLAITVYVDLGLVFFATAALVNLLEWRQRPDAKHKLWLAALFCGLALGTKYNGLVVFFLLTLLVALIANRQAGPAGAVVNTSSKLRAVSRAVLIFSGVSLMLFAPWVIRNLLWTGNPVFPLYDTVFNPQNPFIETRLNPFAIRRLVYGESLWQALLVPLRIFFQGADDLPALFDGRLNPGLLLFGIIGLFKTPQDKPELAFERKVWGGYAALLILIVFFTRDMRIRYIAPAIPAMVVLSIFGIANLWCWSHRLRDAAARYGLQSLTAIAVASCVLANFGYIVHKWREVGPLAYIEGKIDRDAYLSLHLAEFPVVRYANRNLAEEDRLLCVFLGNRRYYFEKNVTFMEWTQFARMFQDGQGATEVVRLLKSQGISHLLIGMEQLRYWKTKTMTAADQAKLDRFMREHLAPIKASGGYALFRLR
jgi:hypothetical protein